MIIFYHRISHSSTKRYCDCSAVCYVYIYTHTYVYMYTSYGFSSIHVCMWELDYKESWAPKNWCFQTVVLEKNLESPLESKEIKLVNAKGNQPWIFIGRTDEAEDPIFWPPDAKSWLTGKDSDAGNDWGQKEKGVTEDEMVGWHHRLNGHRFEQTPGASEGHRSLVCWNPWGHKGLDMT